MTEADRAVRAAVYAHFVEFGTAPTKTTLASATSLDGRAVEESLSRLAENHRLVLAPESRSVTMAHPFSGIRTAYRARIGDRTWQANCGWDAFAILSLLGDGEVLADSPLDATTSAWRVGDGVVSPGGFIHFVVPARSFWDDIAFT